MICFRQQKLVQLWITVTAFNEMCRADVTPRFYVFKTYSALSLCQKQYALYYLMQCATLQVNLIKKFT